MTDTGNAAIRLGHRICVLLAFVLAAPALAVPYSDTVSGDTWVNFQGLPLTSVNSVPPIVMLTMSRDHQLHYKAYNDYSDLDGDGEIESTYSHDFDYYGYFDSYKCYDYVSANGRFEPASLSADKYCGGNWSGNFLNWMSTTRMDAVRKLLYGGLRSTDSSSSTVLERSFLPTDAHSFTKIYEGSDLNRLTPFSQAADLSSPATIGVISYYQLRITSLSRNGSTATATLSNDHGYAVDQWVRIDESNCDSRYGGIVQVTEIVSATSFRYTMPSRGGNCSNPNSSANAQLLLRLDIDGSHPINIGNWLSVYGPSGAFRARVTALYQSNESGTGASEGGNTWVTGPSPLFAAISVDESTLTGSGDGTLTVRNLTSYGVTFCNLTTGSGSGSNRSSQTNTQPPVFRVARGNFRLWSANERWQCYWNEEKGASNSNSPTISGIYAWDRNPVRSTHALNAQGSSNGEFIVRVKACVAGLEGNERCQSYPSGNKKPVGLLQVYGESGRIRFGLVTPTYSKNISGGVVRKNVGAIDDEINVGTDGSFKSNFSGIIQNLNKLRIWGYDYNDGTYSNGSSNEACTFQLTGLVTSGGSNSAGQPQTEGNCAAWGNPIGEAYVESLRYLAGGSPDSRFQPPSGSKDATLGLTVVNQWVDPLSEANWCAPLNVLSFNASVSSYDNDQANLLSELAGNPDIAAWTNAVGSSENIIGSSWFVGNNGSVNDGFCTAKTISSFAAANGICPEAAPLKGSYLMSGAAYFAHTNRIRSSASIAGNPTIPYGDSKSLRVDTYAIQLATNTPRITIPVPGRDGVHVTILPVYRLNVSGNFGGGALVDFRVIEQNVESGTGRFYVNWEDSAQGGDYDQDMWGLISYQISPDGQQITVTTAAISASSTNGQGFGYILSGTNKDGPHFHSGIYGFSYTDPTNVTVKLADGSTANNNGTINGSGGCNNCNAGYQPTSVTYDIVGSSTGTLQDPLFYAAKYGGYTPVDDNQGGTSIGPNLLSEWDARTSDGTPTETGDGMPDNYFLVSNPSALEASLVRALNDILAKTSSGTAAAVVANAREGEGAIYQALYEPIRGTDVKWIGTLHGLFVDANGYLREDGNANATLEGYGTDPVVELFYEVGSGTQFRRYSGDPSTTSATIHPLEDLRTIWNARTQLANLSNVTTQRVYGNSAGTGRYIITALDSNLDGNLSDSDVVDFVPSSFGNGRYGILNQLNATDAGTLVNYVRGEPVPGLRTREVDYDNSGIAKTMRLGDIVSSTPTVVGTPAEAFDLLYNDSSYGKYRRQYQDRRNVVYVASNDGLIHAFNAGFYRPQTKQFATTPASGSATAHPLGSELWAYIPYNLLPHLAWQSDPDYNHVWMMDGSPRVFDARVFSSDSAHPDGWGTVMVIGMRLGGTPLALTRSVASAGFSDFTPSSQTTITTRPAYVVLDITNPEAPPKLMAELTNADLGFTTGSPSVIAVGSRDSAADSSPPASDKWYLVFGSGPQSASTAASTTTAKLFVYDLKQKTFVSGYAPRNLGSVASNSFVGDPVSVDWDLDYKADAVYFGTIGGTAESPSGKLFKFDIANSADPSDWVAPFVLTDPGKPVGATPSVTFDEFGNHWVFAGTGRFLAPADKQSDAAQHLFGLIDGEAEAPSPGAAQYSFSNLLDVSSARVDTNGTVYNISGVNNERELVAAIQSPVDKGWRLNLSVPAGIAERSVTATSVLGEVLFASTFIPDTSDCLGEGTSRLYGLYFKTGAPKSDRALDVRIVTINGDTVSELVRDVSLGAGLAASPSLHAGGARDQRGLTILTQTSTGTIDRKETELGASAKDGEIDWREGR